MTSLSTLQPENVWSIFQEITQIPRASKKEENIRNYLFDFAKKYNLPVEKDEIGNVLIRKKGTGQLSNAACVILQNHMDMVCEKDSDSMHNFETDPIPVYIDGDWIKAKGTTLGADNGLGMAMALAVLASKEVEHPPLECLFTVDEEMGLNGAVQLKENWLSGKTLLNLDTEDDDEFCIGCAGGMDTVAELPVEFETMPKSYFPFFVKVTGLMGGHSGQDINENRGNAIKILAEYLSILKTKTDIRIAEIGGGNLRNAIPREAWATLAVPYPDKEMVRIELNLFLHEKETELALSDPKVHMELSSHDAPEKLITKKISNSLIDALIACPHGVMEMNAAMPALVDTSTNLAAISLKNNHIVIETSQRSAVEEKKFEIANEVALIFSRIGGKISKGKDYPGWTPNLQSPILKKSKEIYTKLFNEEPHVKIIHAGLECGVISKKYAELDMISFGPTIKNPHSPSEKAKISSVQKSWTLLLEILKKQLT
jgi:dipeptidase D